MLNKGESKMGVDKKKYFTTTILCLLTGFLMVAAFQTQTALLKTQEENQNKAIIDMIETLETELDTLEQNISTTRKEIQEIEAEQSAAEASSLTLQETLSTLRVRSGLTEITGPGIIITLDDNVAGAELAKNQNPNYFIPENFIIHDKNLLYLINTLGLHAEAIAINNQRIVTSSHIRCVGTVIMVNSSRMAPPYEIKAIGVPAILEACVTSSGEYKGLKAREMPMKITQEEEITLPAYTGSLSFEHIQDAVAR